MMRDAIVALSGVMYLLAAGPGHADTLDEAIVLARRTLDLVQRDRPCRDLAVRLAELERRSTGLSGDTAARRAELGAAVRQLRREIIFSHPLLDFDRLLVNKCPPPAYSHQTRQYLGR